MYDDVMELVCESLCQVQVKLEFVCLVFGVGGFVFVILDICELQCLIEVMFFVVKLDIVWKVEVVGFEKVLLCLFLNLCIMGVDVVLCGGIVIVEVMEVVGSMWICIVLEGCCVCIEEVVGVVLDGQIFENGFDGCLIQLFYMGLIVCNVGGCVSVCVDEDCVEFVVLIDEFVECVV